MDQELPPPEVILRALADAHREGNAAAAADLAKMLVAAYVKAVPRPTEGMTGGQKVAANVGAGMMDFGMGIQQTMGMATAEDAREKMARDRMLAEDTTGGTALQIAGAALPTAPLMAIPGMQGPAGAAILGATTSAMMPTTNDNIMMGKLQNALIGGATGYGVTAGINKAAPYLSKGAGGLRDFALRQGFGTGGARQRYAERMLGQEVGDPSRSAALMRQGLSSEVPGVTPTTAQLTGDRAMLATERAARATSTPAGLALAEQSATNNAARVNYLRSNLGRQDPDAIGAAASDYWEQSVKGMKLKPEGLDPNRFLTKVITRMRRELGGAQRGQTFFDSLQSQLDEIMLLPARSQLAAIHKFRRTGISDTLNSMASDPQARSGLQKIIAPQLVKFKNVLDTRIQNQLASGNWKKLMKGYSGRKQLQSQAENARGVLQEIDSAAPLTTGDPSLGSKRSFLRKQLDARNETDRFGTSAFNVRARRPMERTLDSLDREAMSTAADASPRSSQTAENLKFLKESGADWTVEEGVRAGGLSLPAMMVHPLLGAATMGQQALAHRAKNDIASRLLTLYRDPRAALAALDKMSLPPAEKGKIAQNLMMLARGSGTNAAAIGGAQLGSSLIGGQ